MSRLVRIFLAAALACLTAGLVYDLYVAGTLGVGVSLERIVDTALTCAGYAAPFLAVGILAGEWLRLRHGLLYLLGGIATALGAGLLYRAWGAPDVGSLFGAPSFSILATMGALGGMVYWLLQGYQAGWGGNAIEAGLASGRQSLADTFNRERRPRCWPCLLTGALLAALPLLALGLWQISRPNLAASIRERTETEAKQALAAAGYPWASLRIDGYRGHIEGTAPDETQREHAFAAAQTYLAPVTGVPGVIAVLDNELVLPPPQPGRPSAVAATPAAPVAPRPAAGPSTATADAKRKADDEAKRLADATAAADAKRKADDEAKRLSDAAAAADAKRKAGDEAKRLADAAAAADAKRKAGDEAKRLADAAAAADAKRKADDEAKRLADAAAAADAKRKADDEAKRLADAAAAADAKRKADEEAKRLADATAAADAKRKADDEAKRLADAAAAATQAKQTTTIERTPAPAAPAASPPTPIQPPPMAPPATAVAPAATGCTPEAIAALETARVTFDTASSEVGAPDATLLTPVVDSLKRCSNVRVTINGHTDAVGADGYNSFLSQRRAEAIRSVLTSQGIAADRLVVRGLGGTQPLQANTSEAGRALNRRVEFTVQGALDAADPAFAARAASCRSELAGALRVEGGIVFEPSSAIIAESSAARLDALATMAKSCAPFGLLVEGHADKTGNPNWNIRISDLRARAVREALIARGVPVARIAAKGFGSSRLLDASDTQEAHARNRRIEISLGAAKAN